MPPPTHNMLTRQLKRYLGSADAMPSEWRPLIEAVNDAYHEFDRDRGMLERSLELSSEELIEANASLRESEERYRTFLDSTADIAFVKDEEFRCVLINKAYQEYFRLPREAIVGKTDHDLMPKPMADNCRRTDQQAMAENNVVVSLEQVGDRIYETRKFPLRLKSGNVGVGGFIRDITERKRAEEALRQSEEKYRVLVETTNTGFLILDAQGKVIDANQDYVRLTGHDMLEEILGRNVVEWTAPYDLERNAREVKKCAAQGFVRNLEIDYVNRSGQVTPIEINATVVGSGGSARILSLCRDITERKRAEQALRESVERFRQIAESAGEWIWEEDAEGLYTYSSPVVEQILGYKPEELVGKKHFYDLFAPYVREEIKKAAFGRALRKEAFRKLANPVVCKDGRVIILETSGVPILDQEGRLLGYRGADTDITERKRADDRLRSQAQLLGCVSESVVATDLDDHILYWGRGAEELYGYAAAEVMGKPYRDFAGSIEPVDNDAFKREIIAKGAWRGEHVQRKRDGTTFWSSTVISLVTDEQGRPAGFIGIDDDITERRKAEARVRQLNRLLRTISDINQLMVREPNRDRLLLEACRILTEHGGFRMAWVGMAEKATGHVRPVAAAGLVDGYLDEAVIRFDDTPEGRGPTGACIRTGSHVVSADLTSDPSYAPWREAALKRGYRSSAAFPLRVRDEIVGALNVYVAEVGVIGDEETGLLDELANDLGYALEVIQDRQERMQAEEALRESEEKYRTLVERANDGVIIVQDAIVKFANRRMAELDGSRVEQIVGTPFTDHVHPTELPRLAENYQRRMRGEPVPSTYETVLRRRDGSPAPAELNAGLIMYEGRPADMVIIRDITERKRAEEKSKEQYEKLRRWHEVTLDREGRVAELKREVNELAKRLDEKPRYGGEEKG